MKQTNNWLDYLGARLIRMRIIIPAIVLLFAAAAQSQPSVSELLADTTSLGPGWDRKIYLQFDSAAVPSEVIQTVKAPPETALNEWRRGIQDPNGKISGWTLAHYNLISSSNRPNYEVHLERYRNHDALLADFKDLLEPAVAHPGSLPLTHLGDAATLVAYPQGTGVKLWFRRGDYLAWISPISASHGSQPDAHLQLLAQAIDQRIASVTLNSLAASDGAALIKNALDQAMKSTNSSSVQPQTVVKIGDAFFPLSKPPVPNAVSFAFDHWNKQGSRADTLAVFRLTNSGPSSILLWNVRVQHSTTDTASSPSGWETDQNDYPSATSAVCEPGSSIEFWVHKPVLSPWRACILYSRELAEPDRPKNSQRTWSGNYQVIGQPVH